MAEWHANAVIERSRLYRLVERGLGEDVGQLIADRRQYGYSFAAIAREISERSQIEISDETARRWAAEDEPAEAVA